MSNKDTTQQFNRLDEKLIKLGFLRQLLTQEKLAGKSEGKHGSVTPNSSWNSGH
jgi:hypothetical protein